MSQINNCSYKYKYVMLTYYWIEFIDVPLYVLYAVICIKISTAVVLVVMLLSLQEILEK